MSRTLSQANVNTDTFQSWLTKTNSVAAAFVDAVTTATNTAGDNTTGNGTINGYFGANTLFAIDGIRGGNVTSSGNLTITSNAVFTGGLVNSAANVSINTSNVNIVSTITTILSNSSVTAIKVTGNSTATNTFIGGTKLNLNSEEIAFNTANTITITGPINSSNSVSVLTAVLLGSGNVVSLSSNTKTTSGTLAQLVDSFDGSVYRSAKYTVSVKNNNVNNYNLSEISVIHNDGDSYLTEYAKLTTNTSAGFIGTFTTNVDSTTVRLYYTPTSTSTTLNLSKTMMVV